MKSVFTLMLLLAVSGCASKPITDNEIQSVFDEHKENLYRVYRLELDEYPSLEGKIILKITLGSNGKPSWCKPYEVSDDLHSLALKYCNLIVDFDFKNRASDGVTFLYPISFLPPNSG